MKNPLRLFAAVYLAVPIPVSYGFSPGRLCNQQNFHRRFPYLEGMLVLRMGRGFNSAKNKQAELARKLQEAKDQSKKSSGDSTSDQENLAPNNPNADRDRDDLREEFSRMLLNNLLRPEDTRPERPKREKRQLSGPKPEGPKVKARIVKKRKRRKEEEDKSDDPSDDILLTVGDKSRRVDFEKLVQLESLQPLGPIEAAKIVPWVPPFLTDYLVILADPRRQSNDLRAAIQYLKPSELPKSTNTIAITPDDLQELAAWKRRAELSGENQLFVDPSLDWMTKYNCVDQDRWSTHLIVIDNDGTIIGHVQKVVPSQVVQNVAEIIS